jgi:hypothetical protein
MSAPNLVNRQRADGPYLHDESHHPEAKDPSPAEHSEHEHGFEWTELARIAFVGLAAAAVWFRLGEPFPHVSVIGIAAALVGGYPIFRRSTREHHRAQINSLNRGCFVAQSTQCYPLQEIRWVPR